MNFTTKTLLSALIVTTAGLAQAQLQATVTLTAGGPVAGAFYINLTDLRGFGSLAFSDDLIGALAVAGIQTTIVAPATGEVSDTAINIGAPILSLSGTLVAEAPGVNGFFTATNVGTLGGATMVAPKANFATSGGSLSVTGISVDLATNGIFATVSGANGLATQTVRVWDYTAIEGDITLGPLHGTITTKNTITGLTITTEAFDAFAKGLGLKAGGIAAMASIADYGVMTSTLSVTVPFPEPSTYLMMGLGLVGLALTARRTRLSR